MLISLTGSLVGSEVGGAVVSSSTVAGVAVAGAADWQEAMRMLRIASAANRKVDFLNMLLLVE
jgi:hypothetical protein